MGKTGLAGGECRVYPTRCMVDRQIGVRAAVKCFYTCDACGVTERVVHIAARGEEDAGEWVRDVMAPAIARDHDGVSPGCGAKSMTNVKVPIVDGVVGRVCCG